MRYYVKSGAHEQIIVSNNAVRASILFLESFNCDQFEELDGSIKVSKVGFDKDSDDDRQFDTDYILKMIADA